MKVHIITVGDEILIGQIVDTNSAWMGQQLNAIGMAVDQIITVGDEADQITDALDKSMAKADVVLITGGLGPTKDDITKKTLANYFNTELEFHEYTYERLCRFFASLKRQPTESHRVQCMLPVGAEILTNDMGTAPGMWFEQAGKIAVSMPGVPYEMKHIMEQHILPRLLAKNGAKAIAHRTLCTAGQGESYLAMQIEDIENDLPDHIKLAYLPNLGQVRIRLTGMSNDAAQLDKELDAISAKIQERLAKWIYSTQDEPLAATLGRMLLDQKLTVGTAESCTGGLVAAKITEIAGASRYFQGAIVAYDNEVKQKQLGVSAETLSAHGAVSEATVKEMVAGAIDILGVDIAVAISGIAGPGGGSAEKPVGTIWMAVGNKNKVESQLIKAGKNRSKNIEYAANRAIDLTRRFLSN